MAVKTPDRVADLLLRLHRAIGIEEQHVDRASPGAAVVVTVGSDHDVDDPIAIDIADPVDGVTEEVVVVQGGGEPTRGVADLLLGLHRAIGVQEEHVDRTTVGAAVVVELGPDHDVGEAVTVEVTDTSHPLAEPVVVVERGGQPTRGVADLLLGLHGAIGVQEQDVDRTTVAAAVIILGHTDGDVVDAVTVEVADR